MVAVYAVGLPVLAQSVGVRVTALFLSRRKKLSRKRYFAAVAALICGCGSAPQWKADLDRIKYVCNEEAMPLGTGVFDQWDYDRCVETQYAIFVQEGRVDTLPPQYRDYMHAWYKDWRAQAQRWYVLTGQSSSVTGLAETERMRYLLQLERERERRNQLRLLIERF